MIKSIRDKFNFTKDHKIQLVKGNFTPSEAADVLFSLISDKIKFHQLQILSLQNELNEEDTSWSHQRIASLKESKNLAKDLILKARDEGYELQINADVIIKLVKLHTAK